MAPLDLTTRALCELAQHAESLPAFRAGALKSLAQELNFDAALFHELSPRIPLDRAAVVGLDSGVLAASRRVWDDNAVALGRLRELALTQGGVASDRDAFPEGSRARRTWLARVAKPLRVQALLAAHLVAQGRIVSVLLLFRRSSAFRASDQAILRALVPLLSVCDALQQSLQGRPASGPPTRLRCLDQRLTPRQREIVEHVALGHTNDAIGDALGISPNTVRNLLTEARARLDAANRAELVRLAVLR
jgi:DNA-binding CsgD family transcriptional regulator